MLDTVVQRAAAMERFFKLTPISLVYRQCNEPRRLAVEHPILVRF